jgi:hypothetical protein
LYNKTSEDYRHLIEAWSKYAGPLVGSPQKEPAGLQFLGRIEDPAIRIIVQEAIRERDVLRAQVNLLKSSTFGIIDLRPSNNQPTIGIANANMAILEPSIHLNEMERDALKLAISKKFLIEQGWREGERGEVLLKDRILFQVGFCTAIRRIIGEAGG